MALKILIIDDSDLVAGLLADNLEKQGFETLSAKNGLDGIVSAYKEAPDLIIMDVDMPILPGYQASRLLKSSRNVREIPIIMHTGLNEDKDRYWAKSSGADLFITKDSDNTDLMVKSITELCQNSKIDKTTILKEGTTISRDAIMEKMSNLYDSMLFRSSIFNMLAEIGKSLGSMSVSVFGIFKILEKITEYNIAGIYLKTEKACSAYLLNNEKNVDIDDFKSICENEYIQYFPQSDISQIEYTVKAEQQDKDGSQIPKRISSYIAFPLYGKGNSIIGSFHIGHQNNNYFSDQKKSNISFFADSCGIQLENTLLFSSITRMQDRIKNVFSKFVPSEIINDLLSTDGTADLMLSEKRELAVLMTDIREFTAITEINEAETVVAFLNKFFDLLGNVIKKYGGTIDKFIGDAVLAVFGAPKSYEDNIQRAYNAAVQILIELRSFQFPQLKIPSGKLSIGIGVHNGPTIVGNIGSADKFNYTVIGDTVNVASRLESLTKYYKRPMIISQDINSAVNSTLYRRPLDIVKVKGKTKITELFSVEMNKNFMSEEFRENYEKAIKLYRLGTFQTALEYFFICLQKIPQDPVCILYVKRCKDLIQNKPDNWTPVLDLDFK